METVVIEGVLRIASGEPFTRLRGAVRLQDVTEADALSSTRAEAPVSAGDGREPVPFRLTVEGPVDPRRRYAVRAELQGQDAHGRGRSLGSTQSHPWRPDEPAEPLSIDVKPWS
jgi:hypothetical protein